MFNTESLFLRYMQPLLAGRRAECFEMIQSALRAGADARRLITEVIWPAMTQVNRLYHADRISMAAENMAGRINRSIADQLQVHLPRCAPIGKRALVVCADDEREEAGAQATADLLQADGWEAYFVGPGVPRDEILELVGGLRPDILVIFGTAPQAVPGVRQMIDLIREVGVCSQMNIIASGGVFNRADGLWQEVGADLFAESAADLLVAVRDLAPRSPHAQRVAIVKKRKRRRKQAAPA